MTALRQEETARALGSIYSPFKESGSENHMAYGFWNQSSDMGTFGVYAGELWVQASRPLRLPRFLKQEAPFRGSSAARFEGSP